MRLIAWFIALLLTAATASAVLWRSLPAARSGDVQALAAAIVAGLTAFVAIVLLARIVLWLYALRNAGRTLRATAVQTVNRPE